MKARKHTGRPARYRHIMKFLFIISVAALLTACMPVSDTPAQFRTENRDTRTPDTIAAQLNGMPEGYVLTEAERKTKAELSMRYGTDQPSTLPSLAPHAENRIICSADSKEHAEMIAHAYNATLSEYSYGIATITLDPAVLSVEEAFMIGIDPENNFPPVEPDYISSSY